MQIIIPMSGFGERFRRAGYAVPKPLFEVDGKSIINYVVDLFPGADKIVFVCNREHLENPDDDPLVLIEVQSSNYLKDDDIVRLEDDYGR